MTKFPPTDYEAFPGSAEHPEGVITPSNGMTQRLYVVAALLTGAVQQGHEGLSQEKLDLAMIERAFRLAEQVCNEDNDRGVYAREIVGG